MSAAGRRRGAGLPPWLALSLRELSHRWRTALFLAVNLALGLSGFVALDAFEAEVTRALARRSRESLGADVAVRAARALTPEEEARLDARAGPGSRVSQLVQLFSMAGVPGRARLVELRAVDEHYPLYGEISLVGLGPADDERRRQLAVAHGAWADPELLAQLRVAPGAELQLGAGRFPLLAELARDAGRQVGFSLAPRVYLALGQLPDTGLAGMGSRVEHQRLYRLPEGSDSEACARALRQAISDPRIRVQSHQQATRDLTRAYTQVSRYLSLAAVGAIFLAGLGASHLLRAQLSRRLAEIAVLLSLGATRATALLAVLAEMWWVALAGAVLAVAAGALILLLLSLQASSLLPPGTQLGVDLRSLVQACVLAALTSTASCLPLLLHIRRLRPAELFREQASPRFERGARDLLLLLPAIGLLLLLALWRSGDLRAGGAFGGIFALCVASFAWVSRRLLPLPARFAGRAGVALRLALRGLARRGESGSAEFVAIALCAHLLSLAPQLRAVIAGELEQPAQEGRLPSFFLFDIQPEQVAPLREFMAGRGTALERVSPLIRARLDAIRGKPVPAEAGQGDASGGDPERDPDLRTRRYNLTYSQVPTPSERLVEGRSFSPRTDASKPAELCLEADFAERLGVALDDDLRFDVQGVPVDGRVTCLKQVRWNSFQPNFFVTVQPGVLEEAPQTFLASIPALAPDAREALRGDLAQRFPNVSAVDVSAAVARLAELLDQLALAVTATTGLSVAVGVLLVFAIARDQARARRWEINLLKVLGADPGGIRRSLDLELGILASAATLAGVGFSLLAAAVLARFTLEGSYRPDAVSAGALLALVPCVCVVTGRFASRFVLFERPLALLREGS